LRGGGKLATRLFFMSDATTFCSAKVTKSGGIEGSGPEGARGGAITNKGRENKDRGGF